MFKKSFPKEGRVNKIRKPSKKSFGDDARHKLRHYLQDDIVSPTTEPPSPVWSLESDEWPVYVGPTGTRCFAVRERALEKSPVLARLLARAKSEHSPRIVLEHDDPEIFAHVLEYLSSDDYTPNLDFDNRRRTWCIDEFSPRINSAGRLVTPLLALHVRILDDYVLRDAAVYCAARKFGLDGLMKKAITKLSKITNPDRPTVIRSMRYAYERTTNDRDGVFRAHFLAILIRNRDEYVKSGTLQREMIRGGEMYFDLFVAMTNHLNHTVETKGSVKGSTKGSTKGSPHFG